jgi:hypothetical protein
VSEPPEGPEGSVLGAALRGAVGWGFAGLAFGLLGEFPWEDVKADAGGAAIVGAAFHGGLVIRARLRAGDGT